MTPLTVLITNTAVVERSGTEMVVHDLALGLLARGHRPVVFSTRLGRLAQDLQARTVPVIDNLADLGITPDVIHAHHLPEAALALLHFPNAPAVYLCHDWGAWVDVPPPSPMVRRYVAVDEVCRDRLIARQGVSAEAVSIIPNAIDLTRFLPRDPLPARPQRALAFSNYISETNVLPVLRAACAEAGMTLDVVGLGVRNPHPRPEELLPRYDLVFAKARCALEAMAVGCAVILCDVYGCGGMVTAADVNEFRLLNFGRRLLVRGPITLEKLVREIHRYDPADAAEVCRQIRAVAGLDAWFDAVLRVYDDAINEPATDQDAAAQLRFAADCVRRFIPYGHDTLNALHRADLAEAAVAALRQELDATRTAAAAATISLQMEVAGLRAAVKAAAHASQHERDTLCTALANELAARAAVQADLAKIRSSRTLRWRQRLDGIVRIARRFM